MEIYCQSLTLFGRVIKKKETQHNSVTIAEHIFLSLDIVNLHVCTSVPLLYFLWNWLWFQKSFVFFQALTSLSCLCRAFLGLRVISRTFLSTNTSFSFFLFHPFSLLFLFSYVLHHLRVVFFSFVKQICRGSAAVTASAEPLFLFFFSGNERERFQKVGRGQLLLNKTVTQLNG